MLKWRHYREHLASCDRVTVWSVGQGGSAPPGPEEIARMGVDLVALASDEPAAVRPWPAGVPRLLLVQDFRHRFDRDAAARLRAAADTRFVCVSTAVATSLDELGLGASTTTIVPGLDPAVTSIRAAPLRSRGDTVTILANKAPDRGRRIARRLLLDGIRTRVIERARPRADLLSAIAESPVLVCLPYDHEGFYLPALEAMWCGTPVVCPDAVGNREYCVPGWNCLQPGFHDLAGHAGAVRELLRQPELAEELADRGRRTASLFGWARERARLLEVVLGCATDEVAPRC